MDIYKSAYIWAFLQGLEKDVQEVEQIESDWISILKLTGQFTTLEELQELHIER